MALRDHPCPGVALGCWEFWAGPDSPWPGEERGLQPPSLPGCAPPLQVWGQNRPQSPKHGWPGQAGAPSGLTWGLGACPVPGDLLTALPPSPRQPGHISQGCASDMGRN